MAGTFYVETLSGGLDVRCLRDEDVEQIYRLSSRNELFYRYHPPFVTRASILEDLRALPPGKESKDKYYLGFFEAETLTAVMDLILDYPEKGTAFIGLFMVDKEYQNRGIGGRIVAECLAGLKERGFCKVQLGADRENPQSNGFWKKCGFALVETKGPYHKMEFIL